MLALLLSLTLTASMLAGCGGTAKEETADAAAAQTEEAPADEESDAREEDNAKETKTIVDASGNEVEVPVPPEAIVMGNAALPSMVYAIQGHGENIMAIVPNAYSGYQETVLKDMAPEMADVNTEVITNEDMNLEAIAALGPDLILQRELSDEQSEQLESLGIPAAEVTNAKDIEGVKELIALLGDILSCEQRADKFIDWYEETEQYFEDKQEEVAALSDEDKPKVLHIMYAEELSLYADGVNPYITELEGGKNIVLTGSSAETGQATIEEILAYDPDIVFLSNFDDVTPEDLYNNELAGQDWSDVSAVKNRQVYKVPYGLYRWAPPNAIEKPLYMLWTASIVRPEIFSDYDIREELTDFFREFFNYELSQEQISQILHLDLNEYSWE